MVVVQAVDHLTAAALAHHQAQVAQDAQLLGHRRLLHLDVAGELADRAGADRQAAEDPHPARGGECLHGVGDVPRLGCRQQTWIGIGAVTHAHMIA
jgi:hypothetical protein